VLSVSHTYTSNFMSLSCPIAFACQKRGIHLIACVRGQSLSCQLQHLFGGVSVLCPVPQLALAADVAPSFCT